MHLYVRTYVRSFIKHKINLVIHSCIYSPILYFTSHHSALLFFFFFDLLLSNSPSHPLLCTFLICFFSLFVLYPCLVLSCHVLPRYFYIRYVCTHSSSLSPSQFTIFIFNIPPNPSHPSTLPFPCFFLTSQHITSLHRISINNIH